MYDLIGNTNFNKKTNSRNGLIKVMGFSSKTPLLVGGKRACYQVIAKVIQDFTRSG